MDSGTVYVRPNSVATVAPASESTGKVRLCCCTVKSFWRGSCGETATSSPPRSRMAGYNCCHVSNSVIQYGHHRPRKKLITTGPTASRSDERTVLPVNASGSENL